MAESFKYGNGVWATKEGSSLAYNDENDNYKPLPFSVTRDSIATRVNKQGLIEVVGKDKLRIDYTDSTKGVALLEPARTNLLPYSEDFSQWDVKTGIETLNYGISPDGTQNSTRIVFASSNLEFTKIITTGASTTGSIYVKGVSGETINFGIDGSESIFTLNGNWQRFERSGTSTNNKITINTYSGATAREIEVWGAQLEAGSYATSYIPTSGSAVPRAADVANGAGNSEVFNDSEGVLFADIAALANDGTKRRISINNGSSTQFIQLEYRPTTNTIQVGVYNGSSQGYFTELISNITLHNKIAYLYKQNNFKLYVSGFQIGETITTGTTFSSGVLTDLSFDNGAGGDDFYGKTKRIGYFDAVLTDAELEALTSYTSFTNMANELNLTIK